MSYKNTAFKKKLHKFRPDAPETVETQRTKRARRCAPCGPRSIERGARQLLADKISGTMVGTWLLIPEYLRLGAWDLLEGWTGKNGSHVEPRLALQLVNEAALCRTGVRRSRSLSQKGFELANGLPFIATDQAMHDLLDAHTVAESEALQTALGRVRRASGHYAGRLLAIDPHDMRSHSKRQTCRRGGKKGSKPVKVTQTFFCLDADTEQPIAFTIGSSPRTAAQATRGLLKMVSDILQPEEGRTLIMGDTEHYCVELFKHVSENTPFDLITPISNSAYQRRLMANLPSEAFTHRWVGMATAKLPFQFSGSDIGPFHQIVQRCGEKPDEYQFKSFLSTRDCDEATALTLEYPKRWRIEEFYNANQALGWNRAGTLNLHIRYGRMTMALVAQAAIHQMRRRLGEPINKWNAEHLADNFFMGLDGDVRVVDDTIVVTFYNAPNANLLRKHYENLPRKLAQEGVDPRIPWLYGFKLAFRFK